MTTIVTPEQWEVRKLDIERLYITKGYPLRVVRKKMASEDFQPSESQYRTRFKTWKFKKARRMAKAKEQPQNASGNPRYSSAPLSSTLFSCDAEFSIQTSPAQPSVSDFSVDSSPYLSSVHDPLDFAPINEPPSSYTIGKANFEFSNLFQRPVDANIPIDNREASTDYSLASLKRNNQAAYAFHSRTTPVTPSLSQDICEAPRVQKPIRRKLVKTRSRSGSIPRQPHAPLPDLDSATTSNTPSHLQDDPQADDSLLFITAQETADCLNFDNESSFYFDSFLL